jgi:hypothetical protein
VRNDQGRPTVAAAYTIRTAEPEHSALDHAGFAKLSVCVSVEPVPGASPLRGGVDRVDAHAGPEDGSASDPISTLP